MWSLLIGWNDLKHRKIPNELSLTAWVIGLAILAASGRSFMGAPWQSACWGVAFSMLVTLPAYAMGKLGAGDVKYLIAVAMLTSFQATLTAFVVAGLLAGALALAWTGRNLLPLTGIGHQIDKLICWLSGTEANAAGNPRFPFGLLISIGLCLAMVE